MGATSQATSQAKRVRESPRTPEPDGSLSRRLCGVGWPRGDGPNCGAFWAGNLGTPQVAASQPSTLPTAAPALLVAPADSKDRGHGVAPEMHRPVERDHEEILALFS